MICMHATIHWLMMERLELNNHGSNTYSPSSHKLLCLEAVSTVDKTRTMIPFCGRAYCWYTAACLSHNLTISCNLEISCWMCAECCRSATRRWTYLRKL